jgi:hypothetical protein
MGMKAHIYEDLKRWFPNLWRWIIERRWRIALATAAVVGPVFFVGGEWFYSNSEQEKVSLSERARNVAQEKLLVRQAEREDQEKKFEREREERAIKSEQERQERLAKYLQEQKEFLDTPRESR